MKKSLSLQKLVASAPAVRLRLVGEHAPRYLYDCERCKFSWNCGTTCACCLHKPQFGLGDPPRWRQDEVDADLIAAGFLPEFHGKGAQDND